MQTRIFVTYTRRVKESEGERGGIQNRLLGMCKMSKLNLSLIKHTEMLEYHTYCCFERWLSIAKLATIEKPGLPMNINIIYLFECFTYFSFDSFLNVVFCVRSHQNMTSLILCLRFRLKFVRFL